MAQLKFQVFTEEQSQKLDIFPKWAGFQIPYFDLKGKTTEFFRFRYLQDRPSTGFAALGDPVGKVRRYGQPSGSGSHVYLPPLLDQSWAEIAADPSVSLVITEGELKAACACSLGVPCIGLGGVYNWRAGKQGQELIPDLEAFRWEDRHLVLCFDSDVSTNHMVRSALARLASVLVHRGCNVLAATIPESEVKMGLDDYALANGADAFRELLGNAEPTAVSEELHKLNAYVAWIASTNEVLELGTGQVMDRTNFTEGAYKPYTFLEPPRTEKGAPTLRYTAKEWVAWKYRNTVTALTYAPGVAQITKRGEFNMWTGWATAPVPGSVAPWEDFLSYVLTRATTEEVRWLQCWFAYPIRFPGVKLRSAALIWGPPGVGKSLLGETMERVYGKENFQSIETADLISNFNEHLVRKQFIVGNEISTSDKRGITDKLKNLITRPSVTVNAKYKRPFTIRDCANYYFTSNHSNAFFLEDQDRRYFVHEAPATRPNSYYQRYVRWLDREGGGAALLHHFLHEMDLGAWNPMAAAPVTRSKMLMIDDGKGDLELWCANLYRDGAITSSLGMPLPYTLYTSKELLKVYAGEGTEARKGVTENGLTRAMKATGFRQVANGESLDLGGTGKRERLWGLGREGERLRTATGAVVKAQYTKEHANDRPTGGRANATDPRTRTQ